MDEGVDGIKNKVFIRSICRDVELLLREKYEIEDAKFCMQILNVFRESKADDDMSMHILSNMDSDDVDVVLMAYAKTKLSERLEKDLEKIDQARDEELAH